MLYFVLEPILYINWKIRVRYSPCKKQQFAQYFNKWCQCWNVTSKLATCIYLQIRQIRISYLLKTINCDIRNSLMIFLWEFKYIKLTNWRENNEKLVGCDIYTVSMSHVQLLNKSHVILIQHSISLLDSRKLEYLTFYILHIIPLLP